MVGMNAMRRCTQNYKKFKLGMIIVERSKTKILTYVLFDEEWKILGKKEYFSKYL